MEGRQKLTSISLLGFLALLFAASVSGRRGWEDIARERPADDVEGVRQILALMPGGGGPPSAPVMIAARNGTRIANVLPKAASSYVLPDLHPLIDAPGVFAELSLTYQAREVERELLAPAAFEIQRVAASLPVAERESELAATTELIVCDVLSSVGHAPSATIAELFPVLPLVSQQPQPLVASQIMPRSTLLIARRLEPLEIPLGELEVPEVPVEIVPGVSQAIDHGFVWCPPESLISELNLLAHDPEGGEWARRVLDLLRQLTGQAPPSRDQSRACLAELRQKADRANGLASQVHQRKTAIQLRRSGHGLERRLDLWEAIQANLDASPGQTHVATADAARLLDSILRLQAILSAEPAGQGWRQYLMLDPLASMTIQPLADDRLAEARQLADMVLSRLESPQLTDTQRQFVGAAPFTHFADELKHWTSDPLDLSQVLTGAEAYERSGKAEDAQLLAVSSRRLAASSSPAAKQLSDRIEAHYRNHNLRIAISADLLNRLLPQPETQHGPVRNTILGVPVRGRHTTQSQLAVRLLPDDRRLGLSLTVNGQVDADTYAKSGPATIFSDSESIYRAVKPLRIDGNGIVQSPCEVDVNTRSQLRGLSTEMDGVPVLGSILRSYVKSKHDESLDQARQEAESQAARQIRAQLDQQVGTQLSVIAAKYQERVAAPLAALDLDPLLVDMNTTEQRLTIRTRLASPEQLGAHTPRPQALSDSLASVQIHETALNNVVDQIGLAGNDFSPTELQALLVKKFNLQTEALPKVVGHGIRLKFAAEEPVRVHCREGHVNMTIRLDQIENGRQIVENVIVKVSYRPKVDGQSIELFRDSDIQIEGDAIRGRTAIALRAVFSKMFPKQRPWSILPPEVLSDPRLADIALTQFVIRDGWIGASIGPSRKSINDVDTAGRDLRKFFR